MVFRALFAGFVTVAMSLVWGGSAIAQTEAFGETQRVCAGSASDMLLSFRGDVTQARLDGVLQLPAGAARARCLLALGAQAFADFADEVAVQTLRYAVADAATADDAQVHAVALGLLGRLSERRGDATAAPRLYERALAAAEFDGGNGAGFVWQADLARLELAAGNVAAATETYESAYRAFSRARAAGDLASHPLGEKWLLAAAEGLVSGYIDVLLRGESAKATLLKARAAVETLRAIELQRVEDVCVTEPRIDEADLDMLPANVAVIYPISLGDRVELLVVYRRDGQKSSIERVATVGSAAEITGASRRLNSRLRDAISYSYKEPAMTLHAAIIAPLLPLLKREEIRTLVFAPEGALREVPLAALYDGSHFLIEDYAIATISGLNVTNPRPLEDRHPRMLLAGLSTSGVSVADDLPSVRAEIQAIRSLGADGRTKVLMDGEFSRDGLDGALSQFDYSIVHLATHATFGEGAGEASLLAFGGRTIALDELSAMMARERVSGAPIELLMLSACETAVGDSQAILGIAGAAFKSGARSVVATMWSVSDQATAELVTDFYRGMLQQNLTRSEALAQTQRRLIGEGMHPYYWAPFILIGNWL